MELSKKRKKRQQMKKFRLSLTINGISGTSKADAEERIRCFIFKNRRYWELDIMEIEEVDK
jgi:N-acyl-L-homoserine lactone synthetase